MEVIAEKIEIGELKSRPHPVGRNTNGFSPCPCVGGDLN